MRLSVSPATPFSDATLPNHTKMFELVHMVTSMDDFGNQGTVIDTTSVVDRNDLLRFRFRLWKSFGSDSGSGSKSRSRPYLAQLSKIFVQNLPFNC
jgi:hypothetical protein